MNIVFKSRKIESRPIKINGKIKKAIGEYRAKRVPMSVLLTNFLAVKSKSDELADAENPWAYFYKGIEGHEVESGVSLDETLFRFATMEIKAQKPSDVINAAFFANKVRNDSNFELGFMLPLFERIIGSDDSILIMNPSPDIVCHIEESLHKGKRYYVVTDKTVAGLYKIQFPEAVFVPFGMIEDIKGIDTILITNRDQKADQAQMFMKCLFSCKKSAKILGLIPSVWLDNPQFGIYDLLLETGFGIKQILIVDPRSTRSTPRKKVVVYIESGIEKEIEVESSAYDTATGDFVVSETICIDSEDYLRSKKTILSIWKSVTAAERGDSEQKRNKAEEYRFSREISLFYRIYSNRRNRFAGVAYYKEIKALKPQEWGKKLTSDIEKGLRADTRSKVIRALEDVVFDEEVYPIIRMDIEKAYIAAAFPLSLKTIWFYCWNYLSDTKRYDHEYVKRLMMFETLANIIPTPGTGGDMIEAIAQSLDISIEDIPYKAVDQIDMILKNAKRYGLIDFDPLEIYVREYTERATRRQQDVRNALVKKHFTAEEEKAVFKCITRFKKVMGRRVFSCTDKSILLATAIRMFTGMAIREVAALIWQDYVRIGETEDRQILISKFVDSSGKIMLRSEKDNLKRFRIVPVTKVLSYLLDDRYQYLLDQGIDEEYLKDCPIVLGEERMSDMRKGVKISHCKPSKISASSKELIRAASIPVNELILPDDRTDLITDFNCYHGDIFLSNFRHKANHNAYLTIGEINYVIGIDAPDTFSRHYCDYANDFIQEGMIRKLCRWEFSYELMLAGNRLKKPSNGNSVGDISIEIGPFRQGVSAVDVIVNNQDGEDVVVTAECDHGLNIIRTSY